MTRKVALLLGAAATALALTACDAGESIDNNEDASPTAPPTDDSDTEE